MRFIAGCALMSSKHKCDAVDASLRDGSPSLLTRMLNSWRSPSGLALSNANALFNDFSFKIGKGSRESSSIAPIKRKYMRLMASSTYQYINLLRSCGALAASESGCSLKYFNFRSGSKPSRNNASNAVIACTALRLPPLARARSTSPSKFSSAFKFAAGSSVTLSTFAATLSLAVPDVLTSSSHFALASL